MCINRQTNTINQLLHITFGEVLEINVLLKLSKVSLGFIRYSNYSILKGSCFKFLNCTGNFESSRRFLCSTKQTPIINQRTKQTF